MPSAPPTHTKQYIYATPPTGLPTYSGANATFKLTTSALPPLKDGELLVKTLYLSNDPAQRGWISSRVDPSRLYTAPVQLNTTMHARAVCAVVASKDPKFAVGSHVTVNSGWAEYAVVRGRECVPAPPLPGGLSETHYLGAFGPTGLTAYYGLVDVARATPADVVVVSGAAGATGSMVVQIARHLLGCRKVIGIAGGREKCAHVKSIGADECVDYKSPTFRKDIQKATGRQANVYFDNVGGKVLNTMLSCMAQRGRIAVCGAISSYNDETPSALTGWGEVISARLELRGFVVFDAWSRREEIMTTLLRGLSEGKIRITEGAETVVAATFEDVPRTWLKLFEGANTGKLVTKIVEGPVAKI